MTDYNKQQAHCKKLEYIITILKTTNCTANTPLQERYEAISILLEQYTVSTRLAKYWMLQMATTITIFCKIKNTSYATRRAELTKVKEEIRHESKEIYETGKICAVPKERV